MPSSFLDRVVQAFTFPPPCKSTTTRLVAAESPDAEILHNTTFAWRAGPHLYGRHLGGKSSLSAYDRRCTAATQTVEPRVSREHIVRILNHVEGGPAVTRTLTRTITMAKSVPR